MPADAGTRQQGVVVSFDEQRGWGRVAVRGEDWYFHCTAVADGSRKIQPDTAVEFVLVPGHLGQLEATDLRAVPRT